MICRLTGKSKPGQWRSRASTYDAGYAVYLFLVVQVNMGEQPQLHLPGRHQGESIVAQGKRGSARNVLLAARAMFTYAVHREMVEFNPFPGVGVADPQAASNERERVLSENEIKHVWKILSQWGNSENIQRAILFILVTGQRPGEVVRMHRKEIDGRVWTFRQKGVRTDEKTGSIFPTLHFLCCLNQKSLSFRQVGEQTGRCMLTVFLFI